MKQKANSLVEEIMEFVWQENPVEATLVGIHRYDDRLERLDQVSRKNKLQKKKDYLDVVETVRKECKSAGAPDVNLEILKRSLEVGIRLEESLKSLDRDASIYPRLVVYGIYQLIARSSEPYQYRALRAIDRMREIPRLLAEGKLNLSYGENIPLAWTKAAVELTVHGRNYLTYLTGLLAEQVPDLKKILDKYNRDAQAAFDDYLDFLVSDVQPRSNGEFRLGQDLYEFVIQTEHKLQNDLESLKALALAEIELAGEQMEALAGQMDGPAEWRKQLKLVHRQRPADNALKEHWENIIDQVRQKMRKADLVSLPAPDRLRVVETPVFERSAIPVAGYIPAPPMETDGVAFFCVTPLTEKIPAREKNALLEGHSSSRALLTVLSQLYPGRHTLLHQPNKARSIMDLMSRQNVILDGWCQYVLETVFQQGIFDNPALGLLILHQRLVDAWRALLDLKLHTEKISENKAAFELSRGAGLTGRAAAFEVRRLAYSPTFAVGALAGRIQVEELLLEFKKAAGKKFTLKGFHDSLLHHSGLPLDWMRRQLLASARKMEAGYAD